MTRNIQFLWGVLIVVVALLNIADVLPDWATFAAVLSLPLMTAIGCIARRTDAARARS
ncbi:hypothetical protein [Alteriqipengyuania lutimaris]|uniref:hypothetical protein n=1 Tax=Alteriqipengyuania lutimaris TaxID=1538146 RepID=UPI0015F1A704|nr:hypothetical protein [Alteriqipengyuania lutimaris]MBB3034217.1 hypothetical protein [Alteriqipengyuania lutimaris]